jgi:hypothetical protein
MKRYFFVFCIAVFVCSVSFAQSGGSGQVYKVGDFGPAGGIVFYDKGEFSNGWRYLEAAPPEKEFTAQWGTKGKDVSGTRQAVGSGKQNTQLIVKFLEETGESGRAAQLCASLNFGGYRDWFLPSKDELDLMYKNLKAKGLGNFTNKEYWSSSQNFVNSAWVQIFKAGYQVSYFPKNDPGRVRAVRVF